MSAGKTNHRIALAAACTLAATAILTVVGLQSIVTPSRFKERLEAIELRADEASNLLARRPRTEAFVACTDAEDGVAQLRSDLAAAALRSQATSPTVEIKLEDVARDPLTALQIRFETSGDYPAVVRTLAAVQALQPTVFIETVDLRAQTSTVRLSFSGRAFCNQPG